MHQPFVREIEGSSTVVLFIHGILGTPEHFRDFLPLVPASWSIHNLLLDGHGKTARDFARSSMEKWKRQVGCIVNHLIRRYDRILIAAHSMGTLFALSEAVRHEDKVKGLFLLAVPLKISPKPIAPVNSMKVAFDWIAEEDRVAVAARDAYSIAPDKRVWSYAGWIPRYLELFQEIKSTRALLTFVNVPCYVFQSEKDELVSMTAIKYLQCNERIEIAVLRGSGHFYYHPEDYTYLLECFQSFLRRNIR